MSSAENQQKAREILLTTRVVGADEIDALRACIEDAIALLTPATTPPVSSAENDTRPAWITYWKTFVRGLLHGVSAGWLGRPGGRS